MAAAAGAAGAVVVVAIAAGAWWFLSGDDDPDAVSVVEVVETPTAATSGTPTEAASQVETPTAPTTAEPTAPPAATQPPATALPPADPPPQPPPAAGPEYDLMGVTYSPFSPPPDAYPQQQIALMIYPDGQVEGGFVHAERHTATGPSGADCVEEIWMEGGMVGTHDPATGMLQGTWEGTVEYIAVSGDCGGGAPSETYQEQGEWNGMLDPTVPAMNGEIWVMNEPAVLFEGGAYS